VATIPTELRDFFEKRTFAHFASLLPDGAPHVTPVWVDFDEEKEVVQINTERGRRKEKNVRKNPAVGISMTDPDDPYRMLSVTGEVVERTTDGAREHVDELAWRYMGVDEYPNPIQTERVIVSIRPDEVYTMDD
jgi:PPOX class probable F420-dependent enzyme